MFPWASENKTRLGQCRDGNYKLTFCKGKPYHVARYYFTPLQYEWQQCDTRPFQFAMDTRIDHAQREHTYYRPAQFCNDNPSLWKPMKHVPMDERQQHKKPMKYCCALI